MDQKLDEIDKKYIGTLPEFVCYLYPDKNLFRSGRKLIGNDQQWTENRPEVNRKTPQIGGNGPRLVIK